MWGKWDHRINLVFVAVWLIAAVVATLEQNWALVATDLLLAWFNYQIDKLEAKNVALWRALAVKEQS